MHHHFPYYLFHKIIFQQLHILSSSLLPPSIPRYNIQSQHLASHFHHQCNRFSFSIHTSVLQITPPLSPTHSLTHSISLPLSILVLYYYIPLIPAIKYYILLGTPWQKHYEKPPTCLLKMPLRTWIRLHPHQPQPAMCVCVCPSMSYLFIYLLVPHCSFS